ncbi:hypothetical protein FRB90_001356 [Tulasnella sp. 427]|nr:hypothetical protein FRB90_001356 [Tulasnella sp. 427]
MRDILPKDTHRLLLLVRYVKIAYFLRVFSHVLNYERDTNQGTTEPGEPQSPTQVVMEPLRGKLLVEERVDSVQGCDLYKGVWVRSDHDYVSVALKYIRPHFSHPSERKFNRLIEAFLPIILLWRATNHPNVLPFYGYQRKDNQLILVSMWSEKRCLTRFLGVSQEMTMIDKLELLSEAAAGLAYLHSLSPPIIHGGIQPTNLIVTEDLRAAWSDIGLSTLMASLDLRTGVTTGGQGIENAGFQASELVLENTPPTRESDVYAFGGLMLYTLSGDAPFWKRKTLALILIGIVRGDRPNPEDHRQLHRDDPMWIILQSCWAEDPSLRPTMAGIVDELKSRIVALDKAWASDLPKRTRIIAVAPKRLSDANAVQGKSLPHLSALADCLALPPFEESPFKDGPTRGNLLPQSQLEGTLTKIDKIGSGGYAEVFQGVWKRPDDQVYLVAIKSIKGSLPAGRSAQVTIEQNEFMTRIDRETTIWRVAQHPNILPFYGYQITGAEALLVSRWCKNGSLDLYIQKHGPLRDIEKLKLLCGAARGLAYLHSRDPPIAHGDIKPQNVIITDEIEATLCDFGIARFICDFSTGMTSRNQGAGTTRYQAKELLLDSSPQSTSMSDIYAFGGLILATMSGKPPFHQLKSNTSIILAITQDQTPSPTNHHELEDTDTLWNLLRVCWSPNPEQRPSVKQVSETNPHRRLSAEFEDLESSGRDKIWKAAQYPNILRLYGYKIVTGGEALLASRWCQNGSLNSYISKSETLQETEKLRLLSGAARGLAYLHSRDPPIAHGDIKPQNVIITDEIETNLCDFGISRLICDFSTGMTSRNPGAGTIRYQAHELLIDDSPQLTTMSNIYAFGGLILETMSRKPPFYRYLTNNSIILAISTDKTPMPAQHQELKDGDPLWNLMRDCWRPDFARRPSVKHLCVPSPSMDDPSPPEGTPPPPPPGQSSGSGSPTDFLKAVIGKRVVVRLLSGVDYRGILSCLDGYMNIALEQTEEHVAGKVTNRYGEAFIRGNNVLYISAAEALN